MGGGRGEVDGGPLFGSLNLLKIIWYIVKVYTYILISKRNRCRTKFLWVYEFGQVGNKWVQKPIRSREQCAQKPIKPLRGPAPWAAFIYFFEKILYFFSFLHKNAEGIKSRL